jgi:hypothetical protein
MGVLSKSEDIKEICFPQERLAEIQSSDFFFEYLFINLIEKLLKKNKIIVINLHLLIYYDYYSSKFK